MRHLDEHALLALCASEAYGVVGRAGHFVLIDLFAGDEEGRQLTEAAVSHGMAYCGVFAILPDGRAAARCEPEPDKRFTMLYAGLAFAQIVADRLRQQRTDDFVRFAESLHVLEDPRD